ncbi:MAG: N-acetylmuramoyl-L-alanine amidase [Ignavibacteria bacterium]|nr:N-acetylmuramoyl-L-alanine amidase [Ignavibacteria bacterium]
MKRKIKHLNEGEFIREVFPKAQIVLHGTASSSATGVGDWWNLQKGAIATAFAIDKSGEVIELFPACYWAYHTGNGSAYDSRNIGIEIANEGYLKEINGKFHWNAGSGWQEYKGEVFDLKSTWRGFRYFAGFTEAQYEATAKLCAGLCCYFDIKPSVQDNFEYSPSYLAYKGIVKHCNLYSGKLDVTPAFNINKFKILLNKYL